MFFQMEEPARRGCGGPGKRGQNLVTGVSAGFGASCAAAAAGAGAAAGAQQRVEPPQGFGLCGAEIARRLHMDLHQMVAPALDRKSVV